MRAAREIGLTRAGGRLLVALLAATLIPTLAFAQSQPGFDCNLFGPTHPCDPYLLYPPGQDLRLTIRTREAERAARVEGKINTLRALFAELRACWQPPALDDAVPGMELSVRLSFKRDGNILGAPRFTYVSRKATAPQRDLYRRAVSDSLARCTPIAFTDGMGGAVAGRPLVIRIVDDRNLQQSRT